ncbi:hypothetical protein [Actibacterium sp. 188UL27-1]|uniref:hypothetical protein n=1 Tax=Actibacterium sp. 188UL27-1 TaxID=2786961 RepID=UPI00195BC711|nr:hypothetical protein [Actibacterium sp. 188UL27-1]MBM7070371.1 hypothetical protein [Actibacterium sp. 188UL27-1]
MPDDYATIIDEQLSCNFVLSASLYFRLTVIDVRAQDPRFFGWHGLLHDTARHLVALSEPVASTINVENQIRSGASDLLHGLRHTLDLTKKRADPALHTEIQSHADRLEAQIDVSNG